MPRSTMRVPQPDIIEHFGNADAVPQLPERCLSRKAGIVRCCLCYRDSVSPYPALLCGFNQIPEALRLLDQLIQDRNIIITALLRHLSDAALIAG